MELKRKFDESGACTHVQVRHTGLSPEQNFSRRLVMQAVSDGWMRIDSAAGTLTIVGEGEDLTYALKREPGYYCTSTGERIPMTQLAWEQMLATGMGDLTRKEALAWLSARGLPETDYEFTMAYECVLSDEQHDKYRAVGNKGNLVAAHTLEG